MSAPVQPSEVACERCGRVVRRLRRAQRWCSEVCRLSAWAERKAAKKENAKFNPKGEE